MNQSEYAHQGRWNRMMAYFDLNAAFITPLIDINDLFTGWKKRLAVWEKNNAKIPQKGNRVQSLIKSTAFDDAIQSITKWGQRCKVKAHEDNNIGLEILLSHRPNYIEKLRDSDAYLLMKAMLWGLRTNQAFFTEQGLTDNVLSGIDDTLQAVEKNLHAPVMKRRHFTALRKDSRLLYAALNTDLADIVELLNAEYANTHSPFITGMMLRYKIERSPGHRYTGYEGVVRDGKGNGLEGYRVQIKTNLKKVAVTDTHGAYRIKSVNPNLYTLLLLDSNGVIIEEKQVEVKRGRTVKLDWVVG